jgi:putative FmdB family regulatory protein
MPLYEYRCSKCEKKIEVIRKFSDPPLEVCPKCGGHIHKLISSPAFHLKGTGWYATDYAKKDGASAVKTDSGDSKKPSSSDAKETPAKTETTATPAADTSSSTAPKAPAKD